MSTLLINDEQRLDFRRFIHSFSSKIIGPEGEALLEWRWLPQGTTAMKKTIDDFSEDRRD
jgi:hypothetical protein